MSQTRIVLADKRKTEYLESTKLSKYSIHREAPEHSPTRTFGSLHLFMETTLGAGCSEPISVETPMQFFILPLIGKVGVGSPKEQETLQTEEALLLSVKANEELWIYNNYQDADIHFLIAGFHCNELANGFTRFNLHHDILQGVFHQISQKGLINVFIGQFNGRFDTTFSPNSGSLIFAWVIQGAFEFNDCLIQKADGLAISSEEILEFEALSNDAMLILFEFNQ